MPISPSSPGVNRLVLVRIEDDDRVGRERHADGDRLVGTQLGQCRGDGRLGRTVGVEDAAAGLVPARHEILRAGFAADQQDPQLRQILLDRREQGWAARHHGDVTLAQKVRELVAHQGQSRARGNQRRARDQRHPDLLDREIEGDRHALIDAVARLIAVKLGRNAHEIADAGVCDRDALRVSGRSRGVDDVADRIVAARHAGQAARVLHVDRLPGAVEKDLLRLERRKPLREGRHRDDRGDLGIGEDEAQTLDRERGIERNIGGVHLHHREHRDVGLGALLEQKPDAVAWLHALLDQIARDLVGAAIELAIAECACLGDDGVALREADASLFEDVIEAFAGLPAHCVVGVLADDLLRTAKAAARGLDGVA